MGKQVKSTKVSQKLKMSNLVLNETLEISRMMEFQKNKYSSIQTNYLFSNTQNNIIFRVIFQLKYLRQAADSWQSYENER